MIRNIYKRIRSIRIPFKFTFFFVGIASTVWFLIRVIPKPSRAGYPCMKAAAPFMSSFVIYLLAVSGSAMLFKRSGQFFKRAKYILAAGAFTSALVLFAFSSNIFSSNTNAAPLTTNEDYVANQPMGEGAGIFPGRVVWDWNPDATDEHCTNTQDDASRGEDGFFMSKNNDQDVIDDMLAYVVNQVAGAYDIHTSWEKLFTAHNQKKGLGDVSYQSGQKIFIKINQGGAGWLTNDDDLSFKELNWTEQYYGMAETSPAIVISMLDQLVNGYGVAQEDIYVGDPIAHIYKHNYEQMVAAFPNVKYVDNEHSDLGRTLISESADPCIEWSDKGEEMPDAGVDYLYQEMETADYMINIAALKAHARAGITLTTKNHFGSHTRDAASHLHDGLIAPENDMPERTEYGMYRVLTDIMAHEKLGGNTVLFVVDGLWGGTEAVEKPVKWETAPFNGDWPNSIIASQDQVALESFCFDLLRNEFTDPNGPGKARPLMGAVDDHMHQAADSKNWPDGISYDPEGDGSPIGSLGVHEHWNNLIDKQYSRNLGYDYGIELIAPKSLLENTVKAHEAEALPLIDGEALDACWNQAQWYHIDQTWINWGEEIDSTDFFGRFKVSWSETENLVYYLVEITDDAFVDGYVYDDGGYPNFDIVEVFLDEDVSGGLHVFDNNAEWGQNSENAFSYHIAVDAPVDGSAVSTFHACDIDGENWPAVIMDYADHIPELTMRKSGNKYIYEFSMKVFNDTYNHSNPEASRVKLEGDKLMGMSMAYCDNDTPGTDRDNFFGSVWVSSEAFNDHWKDADGFGTVRLLKTGTVMNHAVEVTGSIANYEISELNTDLVVEDKLQEVFSDPDGDLLFYSVSCDESKLDFTVDGSVLKVNASAAFEGEADVSVLASDGPSEATTTFKITAVIAGISGSGAADGISCYPNPVSDHLNVKLQLESAFTGKTSVQLFNMAGMSLISHNVNLIGGEGSVGINLSGQAAGYYILRIDAGAETYSMPINKR